MIMRLAALILLGTASVIQTAGASHPNSLMEVDLGDNVTLDCKVPDKYLRYLYWYKQPLGQVPQTVASEARGKTSFSEQFKDPRFTVTKEESQYVLTIRNVSKEDEATYFCESVSVYSHMFINGTFLAVKDHNQQKSVYVKQSPRTEAVQLGDPVTLQCSLLTDNKENQCEHSVHWFRAGSGGFHPGIIYTHWNRTDDVGRSCVYRLSKTIQTTSDAGTYYCAVVSCGEILFGEGTKVETNYRFWPQWVDAVFPLCAVLAVSLIVIAFLICAVKKNKCDCCKAAAGLKNDCGGQKYEDTWIYSAAVFTMMKADSGTRKDAKAAERERIYAATKAFGLD